MRRTLFLAVWAALGAAALAQEGPLPKGVIKPREKGAIPTAVWLAECEVLFAEFLRTRTELDEIVSAGGYAEDPGALSNAINRKTVPAARAVADFCSAYVPDTKWGRELRIQMIDAMVSSMAADAHIVDAVEGRAESKVPVTEMVAEQKQFSDDLISEVETRMREAPAKYRLKPEKLTKSRDYYFQNFPGRPPLEH
jgi:hypothetical protein